MCHFHTSKCNTPRSLLEYKKTYLGKFMTELVNCKHQVSSHSQVFFFPISLPPRWKKINDGGDIKGEMEGKQLNLPNTQYLSGQGFWAHYNLNITTISGSMKYYHFLCLVILIIKINHNQTIKNILIFSKKFVSRRHLVTCMWSHRW
jgi:hypothetical protein